jgi:arginyl-tRNA synthetase
MNFKLEFAKLLLDGLNKIEKTNTQLDLTLDNIIENIEIPPNIELGDLCFPTFSLSKILKKKPSEIAQDIYNKLNFIESNIFDFSFKNAYLNVKIKTSVFYKEIISKVIINRDNYGKTENKCKIKKEYTLDTFNINPFKALHIGHLRNIVTGDSIYRLLNFTNQIVHPIYYGGDVGTHVARWYWYYLTLDDKEKIVPNKNISKWFGNIYIKSGEKLKENPIFEKEINQIQKELLTNEDYKKEIIKLRDICNKAYKDIQDELNITLESFIFESQSQEKFFKIKEKVFSNNKNIIKEDNNTIIANLKEFNLDVLVLVKENGAPLYAAKDIGLVELKKERFPNSNDFLYVVGSEQKLYFEQLFKLFSFIYPNTFHKHISYGLVNFGTEKMSSRAGGLLLYEDFVDLVFKKVESIIKENNLESDIDIIKDISFGTIKFEMLKLSLNKNISFDIDQAINLQGDSAVYIQYSGVRAQSILNKCNFNVNLKDLDLITNFELDVDESKLLKLISEFPNKVDVGAAEFKPNLIANYCLELSHCFNKFYSNSIVINKDKIIKKRRLLLTKAYFITLHNSLKLLGINIPKAM